MIQIKSDVEVMQSNAKRGRKNLKDILQNDNNLIKNANLIHLPKTNEAAFAFGTTPNHTAQPSNTSNNNFDLLKLSSRPLNNENLGALHGNSATSPKQFSLPPTPQSPNTVQPHALAAHQQPHYVIDKNVVQIDTSSIQILLDNNELAPIVDLVQPGSLEPTLVPIDVKQLTSSKTNENSSHSKPAKQRKSDKSSASENHPPNEKQPKKPKFQKRTAHNAIEKKYRSSINDKILELKCKVAGPDVKLQKSGILKRALDYIYNLEGQNKRYADENKTLRNALQSISLNLNNMEVIQTILRTTNYTSNSHSEKMMMESSMPNTPPNSSSDCDSLFSSADSDFSSSSSGSPGSSSSSNQMPQSPSSPKLLNKKLNNQQQQKKSVKKTTKKEAMLDSSRVLLCMCVLSVLFFNPFNLLIPSNFGTEVSGNTANGAVYHADRQVINSRVLNSIDDGYDDMINVEMSNRSASTQASNNGFSIYSLGFLLSWVLNLCLILFFMVRVYVNGEAHVEISAKQEESIWQSYQRASKSFTKKNYKDSYDNLRAGLAELGQTVPNTKLQLTVGIVWHLIRLVLDKIYIGYLLTKLSIWYYEKRSMKLYKLCALFYYEMHKLSYLNVNSIDDLGQSAHASSILMKTIDERTGRLIKTSLFSYLSALYYMLASYNMCQTSTTFGEAADRSPRDTYNLCEFYISFSIYLSFYMPSKLFKRLANYIIQKKLVAILAKSDCDANNNSNNGRCKLNKMRKFLSNKIFLQFLADNGHLSLSPTKSVDDSKPETITELSEQERGKLLALISYKKRLFSSSFLYDSDETSFHFDKQDQQVNTTSSVACDFILARFQDYALHRLTNHILSQSGTVVADRAASQADNSNESVETVDFINKSEMSVSKQLEKEMAHLDQSEFESIKEIYELNLDYLSLSSSSSHSYIQKDTQFILMEFLKMLNNWKLRNFNYKVHNTNELRNVKKSEFVDSIIHILKAYEFLFSDGDEKKTFEHSKRSIDLLNEFNKLKTSANNSLVEQFELLVYDWILSSQTYLWSAKRSTDLDLFNQAFKRFKKIALNHPQISYKIKMYETVMMFTANRNPINLLNPATSKQFLFSKSNQDAFNSMSSVLKKFQVQIVE